MTGTSADEPVDVIDERGRVVDTVTRARMRADRLRHRAVFIAVQGSDGRLLVHRRAEHKDVWPGMWDLAVGGVVAAGEEWTEAAERELREELGVSARLEPLGEGAYDDESVRLVGRCYRCTHDGPFRFTDGEITEVETAIGFAADRGIRRLFDPALAGGALISSRSILGYRFTCSCA